MKPVGIQYLPKPFALNAMLAFVVVLGICSMLFKNALLPWLWVLFAFVEVLGFFYFVNKAGKNWSSISPKSFIRKLFWVSLIIRVIWVIFSYFFFIAQTGEPFDFVMADSYSYHTWALAASTSFFDKGFGQFFESGSGYSDLGYPIYLTVVYLLFGKSIIIARLLFALWSAWTSVLIYKLARRNFGENTGRIAGIMAMLLPNFIYYTGLHLKEPLMVFLIVMFLERSDNLLRTKHIKVTDLIIIVITGGTLFFFRTVLGVAALFALFSALAFSSDKIGTWIKRFILAFWILVVMWLFFSSKIQSEIDYLIDNVDTQEQNMRFRSDRQGGNALAEYGSVIIFAPAMFIAPFPTFVNIDHQKQQMLLSGAYFIRNVFAFFAILALFLLIRRKLLRKHVLILSFILGYLAILARSPYALSERFHMPVLPFLLILAAYGITQINSKNKKYFLPYLALIAILVIGWNWFKLAGRGMV